MIGAFPSRPNGVFCICCLTDGLAEIRLSKKGLPYLSCDACRSRIFWNSAAAVRGYLLIAPEALEYVRQQAGGTVSHEERERYARLSEHFGGAAERVEQERVVA